MIEIRQTRVFADWLANLRDSRAKQKIALRIRRLAFGNAGDVKPIGQGLSELRIPEGKGYRVYFAQRGSVLIVILCGGDKKSQSQDIAQAKALYEQWKDAQP